MSEVFVKEVQLTTTEFGGGILAWPHGNPTFKKQVTTELTEFISGIS